MGLCSSKQSVETGKSASSSSSSKKPSKKSGGGGKLDIGKSLVASKNYDFNDVYEVIESTVGEGAKSSVSKVRKKQQPGAASSNGSSSRNNVVYALKTVDTSEAVVGSAAGVAEMRTEIDVLKSLDHPNIVKAFEVYDVPPHQLAVVMEFCEGGDLRNRVPCKEEQAAKILYKVLGAVNYLHKQKVIHRNLNCKAIAFENHSELAEVKLTSFGLSSQYSFAGGANSSVSRLGSLYTIAPEALQGHFSPQADMWSLGVVAFELLSGGGKPFEGSSADALINKIKKADYNFDGPAWRHVTNEAKDFVMNLLKADTMQRWTPAKALKSDWMRRHNATESAIESGGGNGSSAVKKLLSGGKFEERLTAYARSEDMEKIALNIIARKSTSHEVAELRSLFRAFDEDNDGSITKKEFKAVLSKYDYDQAQIDSMFRSLDIDGSGTVMYTEFLAACLQTNGSITKDRIEEAFSHLDSDGDGQISKDELLEIISGTSRKSKSGGGRSRIEDMIQKLDADGDGQISLEEFMTIFSESTSSE